MYFLIIFLLTFILRSIFVFFFPETGGDYDIYSTVANNILRGCGVSLSDPLLDDCVPHFGGNHGPGYDAFISLIWYLTDYSNNAVRLIQALIYSFFCISIGWPEMRILCVAQPFQCCRRVDGISRTGISPGTQNGNFWPTCRKTKKTDNELA